MSVASRYPFNLARQRADAAVDRAVWAACGWDDPEPQAVDEKTILARLLVLNGERSRAWRTPASRE